MQKLILKYSVGDDIIGNDVVEPFLYESKEKAIADIAALDDQCGSRAYTFNFIGIELVPSHRIGPSSPDVFTLEEWFEKNCINR